MKVERKPASGGKARSVPLKQNVGSGLSGSKSNPKLDIPGQPTASGAICNTKK